MLAQTALDNSASASPQAEDQATASRRFQPHDVEAVATNSELTTPPGEACAATALPGSAFAVAAPFDLDAYVDMNMATLRVLAKNSISATSSSL